ncbi:hypothetical protein PHMEG_0004742 [Phytophthora megakarya]|uniref:FYVE-type domain-containing protein n=1 Tax=Phytophthora megakarya TaxID=4795 RepID=A0A225WT96_9STRA|nr:hypothetical protein PHMEG_0004742 [Phytophthora megakarya]
MMLGSIIGNLDEIMYGVVASTDIDQRIKDRVLQDGVERSKVLHCLLQPTEDDPVRHMSVKWQLYNTRDYVCLDTTGFMHFPSGERVGYCLTHSIDFVMFPHFHNHSIDRGNRSICFFYRQRTPSAVECYARGFFDFETEMKCDPIFNRIALRVIANQWLSYSRIAQLSQMKKLAWWMTEQATMNAKPRHPLSIRSGCTICSKSMGRFASVKTCGICTGMICSRCSKKKLMFVFDASTDSVVERSKCFCARCIKAVSLSNALGIARRKIRDDVPCQTTLVECIQHRTPTDRMVT